MYPTLVLNLVKVIESHILSISDIFPHLLQHLIQLHLPKFHTNGGLCINYFVSQLFKVLHGWENKLTSIIRSLFIIPFCSKTISDFVSTLSCSAAVSGFVTDLSFTGFGVMVDPRNSCYLWLNFMILWAVSHLQTTLTVVEPSAINMTVTLTRLQL